MDMDESEQVDGDVWRPGLEKVKEVDRDGLGWMVDGMTVDEDG